MLAVNISIVTMLHFRIVGSVVLKNKTCFFVQMRWKSFRLLTSTETFPIISQSHSLWSVYVRCFSDGYDIMTNNLSPLFRIWIRTFVTWHLSSTDLTDWFYFFENLSSLCYHRPYFEQITKNPTDSETRALEELICEHISWWPGSFLQHQMCLL